MLYANLKGTWTEIQGSDEVNDVLVDDWVAEHFGSDSQTPVFDKYLKIYQFLSRKLYIVHPSQIMLISDK